MNAKRIRKHIRLFLADHLWIILLFLAAPVALPVFYLVVVEQAADAAWLYYCLLALFVLLCFLLYRLYATWNLYELFCNEQSELEDFLLHAPKGREERRYQKLMLAFYRRYLAKLSHMEDDRKQNKLMIYRWVHQLKTPLSVIQLIAQKNGLQADYKKIAQSAAQIQYDLDQVLNMYKLDAIQNDFHVERISLRHETLSEKRPCHKGHNCKGAVRRKGHKHEVRCKSLPFQHGHRLRGAAAPGWKKNFHRLHRG